jgi:hypothetical protein
MKHDWEPSPKEGTMKYLWLEIRLCANCGAEQIKEVKHSWMKVTGYRWEPLAGRCGVGKKSKV